MKILVLGGSVFLGRHFVATALARGHDVTLFNRGLTRPGLFPEVEKLRGDRDGGLDALAGRQWDVVVDTSGYVPRVVRASAELLADACDRYVFVSTISVYADTSSAGVDESAPVATLLDESDEDVTRHYPALKARCENVVAQIFEARCLIVRPGLVVGPYDPTQRFTYWVRRIARGGRVLAPEPREQPVQLIDVRDLAEWMLRMIETSRSGVYNATGPALPLTMGDLLPAIAEALSADADLVWVDESFLLEQGVEPWSELPLWVAPQTNPRHRGFLAVDIGKAVAAGLSFRPLADTVRATADDEAPGAKATPTGARPAGLDVRREGELLENWGALHGERREAPGR